MAESRTLAIKIEGTEDLQVLVKELRQAAHEMSQAAHEARVAIATANKSARRGA